MHPLSAISPIISDLSNLSGSSRNPIPKTRPSNVSLTRGATGSGRHYEPRARRTYAGIWWGKSGFTGVNRYSHQSPGVVVSLIRIRTSSQFRAAFTFPRTAKI